MAAGELKVGISAANAAEQRNAFLLLLDKDLLTVRRTDVLGGV